MEEEKNRKTREDEKAAREKEQTKFEETVSRIIREAEEESKQRISSA